MVLVDTSVWVELFRKPTGPGTHVTLDLDEVVTCLPVIQEVLQGFQDARAFGLARDSMLALPIVESPLRVEVTVEAAELYRQARRAGLTIRSGVDCLIAVCAMRNSLPVLHLDRDFTALTRISELEARDVRDGRA